METERARCRRCGAPIESTQNVMFPQAGGVEHVVCAKTRKPLTRVGGHRDDVRCFACEQPLLAMDDVVMVGHNLVHSRCRGRLRVIGGASGPSAHRIGLVRIVDPFAYDELLIQCEHLWLDAADVRQSSRHLQRASLGRRAREGLRDE
jgi:hypothetical protein